VQCESPTDALALIAMWKGVAVKAAGAAQPAPLSANGTPPPQKRVSRGDRDKRAKKHAIGFLTALVESGTPGADADAIVLALGLKEGRGIGGAMNGINRVLQDHGFKMAEVFTKSRRGAEGRRWFATPRTQEALDAIKTKKAAIP
jgi:hypothetical protein